MTKKKDSKKSTETGKATSVMKAVKKTAQQQKPKKQQPKAKPATIKKVESASNPKKAVAANVKQQEKKPPNKNIVSKESAIKKTASAGSAKPKTAPVKKTTPPPPLKEVQKPKGSPNKLSMALEDLETKPVVVKPRITRSKSGNLLFQLEYTIRSSPAILYEFLTTPSGLAQWFADKVDINDHQCVFDWEGFEETATIIDSIPDEYIRYRWENSDEDEYFEFRISKNEITGDTILTVTDFAPENGVKDQKMLWDSQIKTLTQQIGG